VLAGLINPDSNYLAGLKICLTDKINDMVGAGPATPLTIAVATFSLNHNCHNLPDICKITFIDNLLLPGLQEAEPRYFDFFRDLVFETGRNRIGSI
jgi:hypothetical protein